MYEWRERISHRRRHLVVASTSGVGGYGGIDRKKKKKKRERNLVNEEKGKEDKCLGEIRILNKYRVL